MSSHYLLASIISNKMSSVMIALVLMTCLFSGVFFFSPLSLFSIAFVVNSLTIMCLRWLFLSLLSLGLTAFLDVQYIFHQIWKFFSRYFFSYVSSPISPCSPFRALLAHILAYLIISHMPERFYSLSSVFFASG